MKLLKCLLAAAALMSAAFLSRAADEKPTAKPYPLATCPVSDEKLGEMGDPVVFIYKDKKIKNDPGREIKLCCKSCQKDFDKDPAKYLKKIDEAAAKIKK